MDAILQALPLAALVIGKKDTIVFANDRVSELIGRVALNAHFLTVIRHPDILDAVEYVRMTQSNKSVRWLTSQGDTDLVFNVSISQIDEFSLLMTFEDKTDFENSHQMRRDFVTNVSHELKTPLTSMLGFIETLQSAAVDNPDIRQRFLGLMQKEAQRMNNLVTDLLSLNYVENEERLRPTSMVKLCNIIEDAIEPLRVVAEKTSNTITFDKPEKYVELMGDDTQLRQVITNLVENALKYGGPNKEVKISLSAPMHQTFIRQNGIELKVEDQGEGIPSIHIPRLVERFYRADDHRSRQVGGTGLGLSIVKHIVNRHRGRLSIKSTLGQGSCFSVYLPCE